MGAVLGIQAWLGGDWLGSVTALVVGGLALIAVFVAGAIFLRVREVTEVWGTVRRKVSS